ncbi:MULTISPECIES: hypothetical protein [unclassified Salipiger]|uniref:hypothetical protein n=1 Tax=unclassified Salipiger TaxID=2640570 RepID=UPI0013BB3C21|nr:MULTISPECIES: hypothetical protein [unclassified Salipiger]NDV48016.1 hypothetical protein [Salipiger sp. PrR003]NDW33208.1 hypothetical protein [Salipiger sp. PrR007]
MSLALMKLRTIVKYRRMTRALRKTVRRIEHDSSGISNEFDRAPLQREALLPLIGSAPVHAGESSEMAVYSTYCGPLGSFTYDKNNRPTTWPHYFVSNNRSALEIVEGLGWKPIFLDLPVSKNPVLSAHQAKVAKALPHLFPDLARHRFLTYMDDKRRIPHGDLEGIRDQLVEAGGAMALRLSPHIEGNILWEFTDSLFQDRYREQAHQMLRYTLAQMESGKTLETDRLFTTNFILRDMADPRIAALNERWYDDILACGIDCQLAFAFLAQGEPAIVDLPAPPRKKYLGKKIAAPEGAA